jgi:hypothetical protein
MHRISQLKLPYVTAGDVIAPFPPTELGVGGGDYWGAKQNDNSRQKCGVFI